MPARNETDLCYTHEQWIGIECSQPTQRYILCGASPRKGLFPVLFSPPGASHFLSNVTLIKIEPFPHRCSNRDTGDNNTPFVESAHAHWEEEGPPVERAICGYGIYLFSPSPHPVFKFTSQAIVLLGLHGHTHRLHEIKSLKCSMTTSQVAAFLVASTDADEVSQ